MLKELFEWLVDQKNSMKTHEGRLFLWDVGLGRYEERHPDTVITAATKDSCMNRLRLSSVASLVDLCKQMSSHIGAEPRIVISPNESYIEAMWNVYWDVKKRIYLDFVEAVLVVLNFDHTKDYKFSFPQFLHFLDLHKDKILDTEERDGIRSAIKQLKFLDLSTTQWKDHGAYVTVTRTEMKGVEPEQTAIPSQISIYFPVGTQEFDATHRFALRINPVNQTITLMLLNRDEVISEFMDECREKLKKDLADLNPLILDGAR